jgi:histidyl-tRNA synthetase
VANQVNPPRGMRDILPEDKVLRERLIASVRQGYLARGFQEVETPALEDLSRLTSGQGGDNEKLVFQVLKRGDELDAAIKSGSALADLGLRFDLTVPLTRYFATNQAVLPRVFKAIQIGPVWRAERPQKGRYRQFLQCDIDIIGDGSILAEAELLSASLSALADLGLADAVIRINHREVLIQSISKIGVPESEQLSAMVTIDKLDKLGIEGVTAELGEKFGQSVADASFEWLSNLDQSRFPEILQPLVDAMGQLSSKIRYDASLVRGMGYYTGAIFEIEHPLASSSIGGGGRYDSMVGKWSGTGAPAVGISLGIERIIELASLPKEQASSLVLMIDSEALTGQALSIQSELIAQGFRCRIELRQKNFKVQMASLTKQGFEKFAQLDSGTSSASDLDIRMID